MSLRPELLLIAGVTAVGALHTLVPDHWVPIALIARSARWTRLQTARAASIAGLGHTLSTLAIGAVVWFAGLALAWRLGNAVSLLASLALIAFGLWMALASIRELRSATRSEAMQAPNARTPLLFILGSSPMLEGMPAFFAAGRFGATLLAVMAACFALATISTYVILCVSSHAVLESVSTGPLERYGEILSGAVIAVVGVIFLVWPLA